MRRRLRRAGAALAFTPLCAALLAAPDPAAAQSIECRTLGGRDCGGVGGLNLQYGFAQSDNGPNRPPLLTTEPNPPYQGLIRGTPDLERREPYYGGPFRDPGSLTPETDFRINFQ